MLLLSLEKKVLKAQSDSQLLETLIASHQGFIRKCMIDQQKASGALVEDEMTVAMLAFTEAVMQFDWSKGKFLSFARLVINRRMVDEYRKILRQKPPHSKSLDEPLSEEDDGQHPYETAASIAAYEQEVKRTNLQMEIALYEEALQGFDLSFSEMTEISPKQEALKTLYGDVAAWLAGEPEFVKQIYKDKKLPIAEIVSHFEVDRKKIERGRKYILAIVVLLNSDLELIKNYLKRR